MDGNNLRKYIDEFFDELVLYDDYYNGHYYKMLLKAGIDVFLDNENSYNAYEIYRTFFMIYQITSEDKSEESKNSEITIVKEQNTLLDLVKIMKKYEDNTGDLIEKQRDHFIHSVNVFLLGLAIYSQNKTYREKFQQYIIKSPYEKYYKIDGEFSHEEFLYRWGIAALFHDIGYPVEIIGKQLKKFINDGVKSISNSYAADTAIDFKDFDEFNTIVKMDPNFADSFTAQYPKAKFLNLFKPTDIMAHKITTDFKNVDINKLIKHLNSFVDIMGDSGFIDHGFFSSILVLNSYGHLMQKHAKNQDFFFYPIVDSATAILLHNYYRNVLQKPPFALKALHPSQSPLSFLLILCDELQEWNRKPIGVKDKKRSHVNDLFINIDDRGMDVEYIVKNGSIGLGFSEDKEEFLKNVLSIRSIFKLGLRITTDVEQDNILKEIVRNETEAPDILLRNVENLAVQIHNQYVETTKKQYEEKIANGEEPDEDFMKKYNNLPTFEELTPQLKIANIRQARSIPIKLNIIGCELAPKSDEREAILEFSDDEVLDLAIFEHDEWCEEKIGTGWVYGEEKDIENLVTPYLVPWDDLTDDIKEYDVDPVKNIPHLMDSLGLKIVRTKIRLLTFEMHNFYSKYNENAGHFDDLPDYIKYSNYKQTDFLVKILSELGYDVVDATSPGEAILAFDEDSIDYLAQREHSAWCKIRFNLGWKYDSVKDYEAKTNPNLVDWDDLDYETREANKRTFVNLPKLCENVGLKIVKSD
ncbi:MAG: hypothetical protein IJG09_07780 [Methanobrevibacter sp.]|nr:hypothetical protein [Methanobrevibacter sp.]